MIALLSWMGASSSEAILCSSDNVPAATLLLPFFEVDTANPGGATTLFSINNSQAPPALVNVTLWTDFAQPTIQFNVALSAFGLATFNMRDIFQGNLLGVTNLPSGCTNAAIDAAQLVQKHIGKPVNPSGSPRCFGFDHGDAIARGYVTIDAVNSCAAATPDQFGYFVDGGLGIASNSNQLWGSFDLFDPAKDISVAGGLVAIEAADSFNSTSTPTGYTFYGRYTNPVGSDNREPLSTLTRSHYYNGGSFNGMTYYLVWRDTRHNLQPAAGFACGAGPVWFPLTSSNFEACSMSGTCVNTCLPPSASCFQLATGIYRAGEGALAVPGTSGALCLGLNHENHSGPAGEVSFGTSGHILQNYVFEVHTVPGKFSLGTPSTTVATGCMDEEPMCQSPPTNGPELCRSPFSASGQGH